MKRWEDLLAETKDALRVAASGKGSIEVDMLVAFHDVTAPFTGGDFFSAGRVLNDLDSPRLREAFERANRIVFDALRAEAVPFELTGPAGRIAREAEERGRSERRRALVAFGRVLGDLGGLRCEACHARVRDHDAAKCPSRAVSTDPNCPPPIVRVEFAAWLSSADFPPGKPLPDGYRPEPLGIADPRTARRMNVAIDRLANGEPYTDVADAYALAAGAPGERDAAWERFAQEHARDAETLNDAISRAILGDQKSWYVKLAQIPRRAPDPATFETSGRIAPEVGDVKPGTTLSAGLDGLLRPARPGETLMVTTRAPARGGDLVPIPITKTSTLTATGAAPVVRAPPRKFPIGEHAPPMVAAFAPSPPVPGEAAAITKQIEVDLNADHRRNVETLRAEMDRPLVRVGLEGRVAGRAGAPVHPPPRAGEPGRRRGP